MSGIMGIYNLDGHPVKKNLLKEMTKPIAHWGPDGIKHSVMGMIGMSFLKFNTTPESHNEKQPLRDETNQYCLVFDGRIDNGKELKHSLRSSSIAVRNDTDAELVLKAYICWGQPFINRILGDFSLAIWDGEKQELFCARDFIGVRPFYFYYDQSRFIWGSEISPFFLHPSVVRKPNLGMIGEYLADSITNNEETLYQHIYRLPCSHFMVVKPGSLHKTRYWNINPNLNIHHKTDREYAENLFSLLLQAVQCRMRSDNSIAAELSGGVDSSAIVGIIQFLFQDGKQGNSEFETFSAIYPGFPCDERDFICEVSTRWQLKSNTVEPKLCDLNEYLEYARKTLAYPDDPTGNLPFLKGNWAREKGFKVILSGVGSDEWLSGSLRYCEDLVRTFNLVKLYDFLMINWKYGAFSNPLAGLYKYGLKPLVPSSIRNTLVHFLKPSKLKNPFPWINPDFAKKIGLEDRLNNVPKCPSGFSRVHRNFFEIINHAGVAQMHDFDARSHAFMGLERRHPFLDRRVCEFCMAIPEEQRRRGLVIKYILRNAIGDLLPSSVCSRDSKAEFSSLIVETFKAHGDKNIFDALMINKLGWINKEELGKMYQKMLQRYTDGDPSYNQFCGPLWKVYGINIWWQAAFEGIQFYQ